MKKLLTEMPKQLNPKVLIPVGSKCGYFYGHLKHTNELLAHLGDNYFKKMTTFDGTLLINKRIDQLEQEIKALSGERESLTETLNLTRHISKVGLF